MTKRLFGKKVSNHRIVEVARETMTGLDKNGNPLPGQWAYCESGECGKEQWHTISDCGDWECLTCSVCGYVKQYRVR